MNKHITEKTKVIMMATAVVGIIVLAYGFWAWANSAHIFPRIFGIHLTATEIKEEANKRATSSKQYNEVTGRVLAEKDVNLCNELPNYISLWTGAHTQLITGGVRYPQYGAWAMRRDCVILLALENLDPEICQKGVGVGLGMNVLSAESCMFIVKTQMQFENDSDYAKVCEAITNRDIRAQCSASKGFDSIESYKNPRNDS